MLGIDIMTLPRSPERHEYLLVVVNYYTRWVVFFSPLHAATVPAMGRFLKKDIFTRWGIPDFIFSDRGSQFVYSVSRTLWKMDWLQSQASPDKYDWKNKLYFKLMMVSYVDTNGINNFEFRFSMNSAVQETTGVTPLEPTLYHKNDLPPELKRNVQLHCKTYQLILIKEVS